MWYMLSACVVKLYRSSDVCANLHALCLGNISLAGCLRLCPTTNMCVHVCVMCGLCHCSSSGKLIDCLVGMPPCVA